MHKFAREAYELGVHYIGGCCGFQVNVFSNLRQLERIRCNRMDCFL